MSFRQKIVDARRKTVAHSDLRARMSLTALSAFTEQDDRSFWVALQSFVDAAHREAIGGPFEIDVAMPDGDAESLVQNLVDSTDYHDLVRQERGFISRRFGKRRYDDA